MSIAAIFITVGIIVLVLSITRPPNPKDHDYASPINIRMLNGKTYTLIGVAACIGEIVAYIWKKRDCKAFNDFLEQRGENAVAIYPRYT